ncbi:Non-homologous end-joining factor 1 [Colletotrichum shisoi]|uniref:Non-homologous end-joining factor 1 n=1 Tax=Colletotrichum shisoi TaxID=2078593 RepID=A0A5Q4BE84_9PEZI|nr:Non-homologous end-joining factor 1 [Colletotrichum shisoi]
MTTPPIWRQLPVSSSTGLPNLLVSTSFSTAAYTIHVTDLANLWVESLDRKAIYKRSLNESTSIDPTDSDSNMRAFLSKIRSVFEPSHPDHDRASMTLSTTPSKEAGDEGLTLSITCELQNMNPLEWPVYLQKCSRSDLATELVVPLAQAHSNGRRQVESLNEVIKQKDAIIMKLLDKLEATGTRLENVFTVLSAKQKPTRKMAEDKVKGLAPFRPEEWKAQPGEDQDDLSSLIQDVFGADGLEYRRKVDVNGTASLDNWWTISQTSCIPIVGPKSGSRQSQQETFSSGAGQLESKGDETKGDDDDDDFQVQSTPPHLISTRKRSVIPSNGNDDDSTEDEDTSLIPDSVLVPPLEQKAQPSRLGTIGRRATPMSTGAPSPPKAAEPDGSETETESDEDATASLAEASSPPQRAEPRPGAREPKSGLGLIGGQARRSTTPGSPKKEPSSRVGGEPEHSDAKSPEPPKRVGLGRIGGGTRPLKVAEPPPTTAVEERGRSQADTEPQARLRETSQERANRKRDELQRELQKKAASGPARKKRKF